LIKPATRAPKTPDCHPLLPTEPVLQEIELGECTMGRRGYREQPKKTCVES
jgi:hypothetical protein